ncbi:MAG TPA: methyltransferase domain-containing protein [Solirubrobacterales bacterium]|jgi:SAM-dependent methyltransferase|nr:methyltransferase domain-containing protein [Solirubrobacterales bacterium]
MSESVDLSAVRDIQQKTWSEGDFAMVAGLVMMVAEELVEALQIVPDERVLDVACGSGNGALAAARRSWGNVVGADFVPALLERGRERATAERLDVEFVEADATDLPFGEAEFDVVTSIFGAMFAADQEKAAAELLRACKPGGRIGMANWVPDGGVGRMFMTTARHAPPPPGVQSPLLWGTEERLRELFGDDISNLRVERRRSRQTFRSADHFLEFFRTYFGPVKVAFERVGAEGEAALETDLREYLAEHNTAGDRALVLEPEYLQVVATRA